MHFVLFGQVWDYKLQVGVHQPTNLHPSAATGKDMPDASIMPPDSPSPKANRQEGDRHAPQPVVSRFYALNMKLMRLVCIFSSRIRRSLMPCAVAAKPSAPAKLRSNKKPRCQSSGAIKCNKKMNSLRTDGIRDWQRLLSPAAPLQR